MKTLAFLCALLTSIPFALWLHFAAARFARRPVNSLRRRVGVREEPEL